MSDHWINVWTQDCEWVQTGLLQHVRAQWETGWIIVSRVNLSLSEIAGHRVMGTSGQVFRALREAECEGEVEKRKGPFGFVQWRRTAQVGGSA